MELTIQSNGGELEKFLLAFLKTARAVQYQSAVAHNRSVIITRNTKDFKKSTIKVMTAKQFLSEHNK